MNIYGFLDQKNIEYKNVFLQRFSNHTYKANFCVGKFSYHVKISMMIKRSQQKHIS